MIKITRYFYIHPLVLPLLLLAWLSGGFYTSLTAYAVVAVHELFHLFAALAVHERVGSIMVMPFGMTLRLSASVVRHSGKEMFIAAAGPFANILMLAAGQVFKAICGASLALYVFYFVNIATLAVNLLPCLPLDGGRIVKAVLVRKIGYIAAASIMRRISRVITWLLFLLGVLLLVLTRLNVSLLIVAGFLALELTKEQKKNEYIIMQEFLYVKDKLLKKGVMPARSITAKASCHARDLFKMLNDDSFAMIYIIDKQNAPVRIITEAQLVAGILEKGWQTTLEDI